VLYGRSNAGQLLGDIYPQLIGLESLPIKAFLASEIDRTIDVLFLALPHGQSHSFMAELLAHYPNMKVIDLSADFRLQDDALFEQYYGDKHAAPDLLPQFIYGLPELYRNELKSAAYCAAPGCYATAGILAGLPLSDVGDNQSMLIDAKSGASGAGRSVKETTLFCEVNEGFSAYSTGVHRHTAELEGELNSSVFFSPHLVPMNRGILATAYITTSKTYSQDELFELYQAYYATHPFVIVQDLSKVPQTRYVSGSNFSMVYPRVINGKIVVFSVIDNLMKGASGQAVQCMNLMCGFEEDLGLDMVSGYV
jgi:N-acetyl-gamma-glutamyl-phosphate reductase